MSKIQWRAATCLGALLLAGSAHADMVSVLSPNPIASATSVAFDDTNVTVGTIGGGGAYNFLDQYQFTLNGSFQVSSIAASIAFTDASGQPVLFGVTNLQVNLVTNPVSGSPIVSWQTVSTPATGLEQTVALIPTTPLGAGNYELQVRGYVTTPGSYSGSLIADPPAVVPLPDSARLLAAGLGVLALVGWRRRPHAGNPVRA